jgi:hypothetical protein
MADNETSSLIADLTKQLGMLSGAVGQEIKTTGLVSDAYREDTAQTKAMTKAQKDLSNSIQKVTTDVLGFAKTLQNGNGSFAPLTDVVSMTTKALGGLLGKLPLVGGALEGLTKGAGEVANMMIDTYDKVYGSFEKLSDSGVVESFDKMKSTSMAMGMSMTSASDALQKRSKELALFGGSALQGTKMFKMVANGSIELRDDFQKLGISSQDFSDFQISYINQQNLLNGGKKKTTDEMISGSANYMKELDAVSKLTGESRKQLQLDREERLNDASLLSGMKQFAPEMQDKLNDYLDKIKATGGKEASRAIGLAIVRNGLIIGEESKKYQQATPELAGVASNFFKTLKEGTFNTATALQTTGQIAESSEKRNRMVATQMGSAADSTAAYTSIVKLATLNTKDNNALDKEYAKTQDDTLKDKDSQNAKLAATKRALEKSQINIEQLATSSKLVTGLMGKMAEGLESVTEKFYKMVGEDMPEHLQAASNARAAIKEELQTRKDLEKADKKEKEMKEKGMSEWDPRRSNNQAYLEILRQKLEKQTKQKEEALEKKRLADIKAGIIAGGASTTTTADPATTTATAAPTAAQTTDLQSQTSDKQVNVREYSNSGSSNRPRSAAPSASGTSARTSGSGAGYSFPDSSELSPKLATISSKTGAKASVNAKGAAQFQRMIDWFDSIGYPIKSLGGYNNRNIAGTNTPSWHSAGLAIDINPAENPYGSRRITDMPETPDKNTGQMAQSIGLGWGANWPNIKDAMHFSLGPNEGGRLPSARTGGIFSGPDSGYLTELHGDEIVAPVGKQALNTSMLTNSSSESDAEFDEVYNKMESKLDALISVMHDNMKANKKQSMAKFV